MKVLSYDTKNPVETKRSFQEEWAPHRRQTDMSFEWWYVTANLHDAEGNPYFAYIGMQDHNGAIMQNRLLHQVLPENMRSVALTATLSDYSNTKQKPMSPAGVAVLPDSAMFDDERNEVLLDGQTPDGKPYSIHWDYVGDAMHAFVDCPAYIFDFHLSNCADGVWHKDSLGTEGMIQQGPETEFSFYYSLTNCPIFGKIKLKDEAGMTARVSENLWRKYHAEGIIC